MSKRKQTAVLTGAIAAMIWIDASTADAGLVIDMRAVSTTNGTVLDPKTVFFTGVAGDTATLHVVAVTTGINNNPNDDGISSFAGSFLSANGRLLGNMIATRAATVMGTGGSNGLMTDLDGDADLDVGSNNNASSANFFQARVNAPFPLEGTERVVGTVTWTFTGGGFDTRVNFRPRVSSTAGSWFEDGTQITSSHFSAGIPVIITLPEPSSLLLVGLTAYTMLARCRATRRSRWSIQ